MSAALKIADDTLDSGKVPDDLGQRESSTAAETAINIRGLRKSYGKVEAVRGIDLKVARGEIFGLIGPDGAGKTSVFHILGGVMEATEGEALILGRARARHARQSVTSRKRSVSIRT